MIISENGNIKMVGEVAELVVDWVATTAGLYECISKGSGTESANEILTHGLMTAVTIGEENRRQKNDG